MTPFLVGMVIGAALACCAFVLFATRQQKANRVPDIWKEEYYQKRPEVVTHVAHKSINRKREIVL